MECMFAGRPVLACNSGGPTESVQDGRTGFLRPPSPEAFSAAMATLLDDPTLAAKMGRKAHKHARRTFSLETFTSSLEEVMYEMLH